MDRPIRIALTKGRLEKDTVRLLESLGYDCTAVHEKGRRLILPIPDGNMEVVLAKAAEPFRTWLSNHTPEKQRAFFVRTAEQLWAKDGEPATKKDHPFYDGFGVKTIATKYPNVTRAFFERKGMDVDIVKIEGSVELAPLLGLADGIVDIVETGTTLKENGLAVVEDVAKISARLIVNTVSLKMRQQEIEALVRKVEEKINDPADQV